MNNLVSKSRSVVKVHHLFRIARTSNRRRCLPQSWRYWSCTTAKGSTDGSSPLLNRTVQLQSIMKDYPNLVLSKYDVVELEEFIYQTVANEIGDPVLDQTLSSLQWLQKRMHLTYSYPDEIDAQSDLPNTVSNHPKYGPVVSIQMELRLPSLLYPKLEELQLLIQRNVEEQTQKWLVEKQKLSLDNPTHPVIRVMLHVVPPTKPIPVMAHFVEDAEDLLKNLGPGLTSVAHFVAVYSCKVRFPFRSLF